MDKALLNVHGLVTGYGKKQVLSGVSMCVQNGEMVAIIGPNGAGKSTVLRAVSGLLPAWQGDIRFQGERVIGPALLQSPAGGIAFAPQGSRVFSELTVAENLVLGGFSLSTQEARGRIAEVVQLFPVLAQKSRWEARTLSGGEQQMLALARSLVPCPKLLILDEPSLGLSPSLTKDVFAAITAINRNTGIAVLIVEQKVHQVLDLCQRVYCLRLGEVAFAGESSELRGEGDKLKQLFLSQ